MGDGIVGHITKGIVLTKVDALLNHKDAKGAFDQRDGFLTALKNQGNTPADYRTILEAQAGVTVGESNYLGATWYGTGPEGWWPDLQPVYPIVRQGLIKAVEAAGRDRLVDSYWLPAAPAGLVEVIVCCSAAQVTRIILTPPSPAAMRKRHTDADMWVVKKKMPQDVEGMETNDEIAELVEATVTTWRGREFP